MEANEADVKRPLPRDSSAVERFTENATPADCKHFEASASLILKSA